MTRRQRAPWTRGDIFGWALAGLITAVLLALILWPHLPYWR